MIPFIQMSCLNRTKREKVIDNRSLITVFHLPSERLQKHQEDAMWMAPLYPPAILGYFFKKYFEIQFNDKFASVWREKPSRIYWGMKRIGMYCIYILLI